MTAMLNTDAHLDALFTAHLLCEVCEMAPWTVRAARHDALLCAACAASEPDEENEGEPMEDTVCVTCGAPLQPHEGHAVPAGDGFPDTQVVLCDRCDT